MISRRAALPLLAGIPLLKAMPQPAGSNPRETRLLFGGDVMLARYVGRLARERHDPAWPLRALAPVLAAADITFVNLESPFSDHGAPTEKGMVFKAEPEMISALELAGVDVVSTANNHSRDSDAYGVEFTLDWLRQHGIAAVGSGKSAEEAHAGAVLTRNGVRFGFLAYTYDQLNGVHTSPDDRVSMMDVGRMRSDVAGMFTRADAVIVSMHAGREYAAQANPQQVGFAHAAIDAGALVVAGHHPHVVQPWERRGPGVIFYSLGNLVFDQFQRAETQHGILGEVVFSGSKLVRAATIPVDIVATAPRLAPGKASPGGASSASGAGGAAVRP
jgi:poly-gamma-glutamate capsule biosynthesis protein CapA/YwtB (metallophosphatase superfamily)